MRASAQNAKRIQRRDASAQRVDELMTSVVLDERAHALALVAHELRSPLAAALESLHALRLLSGGGRLQDQVCNRMERQLRNMASLVQDLLELSRADAGKLAIRHEPVNLVQLVQTAVDDRRDATFRAGVTVALAVPRVPIWGTGDELRLRQVLDNLLDNAEKFTHAGGSISLTVVAEPAQGLALLRVHDTGEAIEPELMPSIFEPFVQAERSAGRANPGLGLGLALVKRLVGLHGGSVEACSEGPGRGAEFLVRLPLSAVRPAAPKE